MKNYKKITLKCGVPLYLFNDSSLKQTFVNYIVKYGSSGEYFDYILDGKKYHVSPGYAHYLEHLLVEHSKYGDIYNNFSRRYYETNAYTALDHTSYFFYGVDDVKKSIKELIEAIEIPVFNKKDVNQTRHAIEEEATSRCDEPLDLINCLTLRNLYKDFEYIDETLSYIGNRETTKNIIIDKLIDCYNAFYSDYKNKVLVIVGNVNEKELVDYLNEIYANIHKKNHSLILPKYNYGPLRKVDDVLNRDNAKNMHSFGIKVEKLDNVSTRDMNFVLYLNLGYIFYGDYYNDLKNKGIIDARYDAYLHNNGNCHSFIDIYSSSKGEEYLKRILDKLNKKDLTKDEYELLKKTMLADEVRKLDNKYNPAYKFGDRMFKTYDYSDIDYIRSKTYDEYKDINNRVDFNTYTKCVGKRG